MAPLIQKDAPLSGKSSCRHLVQTKYLAVPQTPLPTHPPSPPPLSVSIALKPPVESTGNFQQLVRHGVQEPSICFIYLGHQDREKRGGGHQVGGLGLPCSLLLIAVQVLRHEIGGKSHLGRSGGGDCLILDWIFSSRRIEAVAQDVRREWLRHRSREEERGR